MNLDTEYFYHFEKTIKITKNYNFDIFDN